MPDSAWVTRYMDAWSSRDGGAVAGFLAHNVVYTDIALGETFRGADAVRDFCNGMSTTFSSDFSFSVATTVCTDDSYAVEWTMTGTNDGADAERGLPATGKRYEIPGVSIGRTDSGKIVENRDYWNLAGYLMQVGLMPAPELTGSDVGPG